MLLVEIKRPTIQPKRQDPAFPHRHIFNPNDMPQRFQKVGSGIGAGIMDSEVYVDKQHPNRILKSVHIRNLDDPYYRYIRMIEQHQNNPFFPRIYGFKVVDHDDTEQHGEYAAGPHHILYVFMEKLHPITVLEPDHIKQLLINLGINYIGKLTGDYSLRNLMKSDQYRTHVKKTSVQPKFVEAMRLLEPMIKKFGQDLHIDNLMVRLTGVGPQIVITDPLYPSFGPTPSFDYHFYEEDYE